jgi:hypothetical protein
MFHPLFFHFFYHFSLFGTCCQGGEGSFSRGLFGLLWILFSLFHIHLSACNHAKCVGEFVCRSSHIMFESFNLVVTKYQKGVDCKGIYALPIILAFGEYKVRQD